MRRAWSRVLLVWSLVVGIGCAGDDEPSAGADASVDRSGCVVPVSFASLGELAPFESVVRNQQGSMRELQFYRMTAVVDDGDPPDTLQLELWDDFGPYLGGDVVPGIVELTGTETDYDQCGACLRMFGDIDPVDGATQMYMAASGTITIESVTGRLIGSLADVRLVEYDFAEVAPVLDGCDVTIDQASFDVALDDLTGGGGGGGGGDGGGDGSGDGSGGGDGSG